jgi:diadenylate cyclase
VELIIDYLRRIGSYNRWVVGVELILIGLVVYWIINFLEGTRGERLFKGVLFILVTGVILLKLIFGQFGFERLQFLYKGFLLFLLIITIVAFQPEIRRALIRIGQPRLIFTSSTYNPRTTEEIVTAVMSLSASKTGAIIVIENNVALGEFIETGVRLDAYVSSELLRTIFYDGTSLHDMAVVIKGDKIVAARVQLPLIEAGTMGGIALGSRHRAALGITIGSDAMVIIASEETGIISVAENGKLIRNIEEEQLREIIEGNSGTSKKFSLRGYDKNKSART